MRKSNNREIREAADLAGVYLWQVADEMGIADNTLSRVLRYELPENEKAQILKIISSLAQERGN